MRSNIYNADGIMMTTERRNNLGIVAEVRDFTTLDRVEFKHTEKGMMYGKPLFIVIPNKDEYINIIEELYLTEVFETAIVEETVVFYNKDSFSSLDKESSQFTEYGGFDNYCKEYQKSLQETFDVIKKSIR